jgi:hypothetical protein
LAAIGRFVPGRIIRQVFESVRELLTDLNAVGEAESSAGAADFIDFRASGSRLKMAETYFITGAQGCIGSWIVKALATAAMLPLSLIRP